MFFGGILFLIEIHRAFYLLILVLGKLHFLDFGSGDPKEYGGGQV